MKKIVDARMGEEIYHDRVGGLALWAVPRPASRQKSAVLSVDFGSVDLQLSALATGARLTVPEGTAHFIEHRLFEKDYGDITDRFSSLGGEINASTSFTSTVFTMTCIENYAANLQLLFELVFDLQVSEEGVEREREIIDRELRTGSDDPEWQGFLHGLQALYGGVPLACDMAGTKEGVAAIDMDTLTLCHEAFYRTQHMGLFLCGDFDIVAICESVEDNLAKYQRESPQWDRATRPLALPSPRHLAALELEINRPYAQYFFGDKQVGLVGSELLYRELALELALDIAFGPASDFFAQHYGKGLIVGDDFGAEVYAEPTFCFCAIGGYTEHWQQLSEQICVTLNRLDAQVEDDFPRAKRKAYGQLLRSCEQVEQVTDLLNSAISNRAEPSDYFDVYENITVDHVYKALSSCLVSAQIGSVQIRPSGEVD